MLLREPGSNGELLQPTLERCQILLQYWNLQNSLTFAALAKNQSGQERVP